MNDSPLTVTDVGHSMYVKVVFEEVVGNNCIFFILDEPMYSDHGESVTTHESEYIGGFWGSRIQDLDGLELNYFPTGQQVLLVINLIKSECPSTRISVFPS